MKPVLPPYRRIVYPLVRTAAVWLALGSALPLAAAGPEPILLSSSGEARLELATGERVTARLPPGASLDSAATVDRGWLATGTQPAAGPASGRDLLLLSGQGSAVSFLPAPPDQHGTLRQEPLPLVEDGRLAGLVWLEGDDRRSFDVRFSAWTGAAWDTPETVAPQGPGSQLALTAARLADGSWLLAWSAFDGHDDEIVWSRRLNGTWSRPQRVAADNDVPDVTPALTAQGSAALLAWSRYDKATGGYRVVASRFSNGRWTAPAVAGPAGSSFPSFEAAPAGTVRMLYRTGAPQGWEVLEMDTSGRPLRRAAVLSMETSMRTTRPVLATEAGAAVFRWPAAGTKRTAAWERGERKP